MRTYPGNASGGDSTPRGRRCEREGRDQPLTAGGAVASQHLYKRVSFLPAKVPDAVHRANDAVALLPAVQRAGADAAARRAASRTGVMTAFHRRAPASGRPVGSAVAVHPFVERRGIAGSVS